MRRARLRANCDRLRQRKQGETKSEAAAAAAALISASSAEVRLVSRGEASTPPALDPAIDRPVESASVSAGVSIRGPAWIQRIPPKRDEPRAERATPRCTRERKRGAS